MIPDPRPTDPILMEALNNALINQAYLSTIMKAQAQILAIMEEKEYTGILKSMSNEVHQNFKELLLDVKEKYK